VVSPSELRSPILYLTPEACNLENSGACDHGFAWPPAGWIFAEPACSLPRGSLLSGPHLHAPREDLTALAVDGPFAAGYACRASKFRVEVLGVAGEVVDEVHVVLFIQQASLRRADLLQREAFALTGPLGEVAE
jgi:hypothetical protein